MAYLIVKEWSKRAHGEDLRALFVRLTAAFNIVEDARILVLPPPPIQGIGNAGGFTLQIELRDGSSDFVKLQSLTQTIVSNAQSQSALQRVNSSFRAIAPQFRVEVDRVKAQTVHLSVDQVFSALSSYIGASFVSQITKFGRTFQVYVQADAELGMLTSTCLAVLFVPSLFVVVQRFEESLKARTRAKLEKVADQ